MSILAFWGCAVILGDAFTTYPAKLSPRNFIYHPAPTATPVLAIAGQYFFGLISTVRARKLPCLTFCIGIIAWQYFFGGIVTCY